MYSSYNNQYYIQDLQNMRDRIDKQLQQYTQTQPTQQPSINQTFQLASPNPTSQFGLKYASTIDDVNKEIVYFDTPFFSKDMSVVWIKNVKGEIKSYELNEIIKKDSKDIQIDLLMAQIEELKGMIKNERSATNINEYEVQADTETTNGATRKSTPSNKSTSVSRISKSKE